MMIVSICLFLAIASYTILYCRTKDILNPVGVFSAIWFSTAGISSVQLMPGQNIWSIEMIAVVILSGLFFVISGYLVSPVRTKLEQKDKHTFYMGFFLFSRLLFLASFLCVLLEWRASGYILPGIAFNSSGDLKSLLIDISGVHYGSILMPVCGIISFYELLFSESADMGAKLYCIGTFIFSLFYSWAMIVSRGTLLMIVLSCIYIFHKRYVIRFQWLCVGGIMVIVALALLMGQRVSDGSLVYTALGGGRYKYVSAIYSYIAYNFENLNKLVEAGSPMTIAQYMFLPVWHLVGIRDSLNLIYYDTFFFNARTFLYGPYHDLGLLGAILFSGILGTMLGSLDAAANKNNHFILLIAVLQKAIVVNFFGNYFTAEFIIMWPYIVILMLLFLGLPNKRHNSLLFIQPRVYSKYLK